MAKEQNELNAKNYTKLAGFDGDWRDFWWNQDYLELLAARTDWSSRRRVLDVGCGVGHWGQRLLPLAHPDATMVGIDRESEFLDTARARAAERGLGDRIHYQAAVAEDLPFPDQHFDAVTCQTVLMHTTDAAAVLREMKRVLAPGGLLLLAEPDNFVNALAPDRGGIEPTVEEALAILELRMVGGRGKLALGHGDEFIGSKLFSLVSTAGFGHVRSWTNDRTAPLRAPYTERAMALDAGVIRSSKDFTAVLEKRSRGHWIAGGGKPERFDGLWATLGAYNQRVYDALDQDCYERGGGFMMYVVAGEKLA
jgi:ubiquinone/menaquinone biosynthesis C-methylase UbiE